MKTDGLHIFSHDLAQQLNLTPEQVRRDLMLLGISGNHRRGYNINELIDKIRVMIDVDNGFNIAIVGMGNLGRAVSAFIRKSESRMNIVAGFDNDTTKINKPLNDVPCFPVQSIKNKINELSIDIAILTTPTDAAQEITNNLIDAGIKGILNFTSVHLDVPPNIYLKAYDIVTSLEEIGFFIKSPDAK